MKKYKYYIMAVVLAVALTLLQIFISRSTVQKDEGYIYIASKDILKGDCITAEYVKKIMVYGYTMEMEISDNLVCITDMPKGSILTKQCFVEKNDNDTRKFISIATDKNRCALTHLSVHDRVDLFIMPDLKSISIHESAWLDNLLMKEKIVYDSDRDIGFVIEGLTVSSILGLDTANQNIIVEVEPPIDRLLAFLKNKCVMEFIIPLQY